jgi:hypothetical protein
MTNKHLNLVNDASEITDRSFMAIYLQEVLQQESDMKVSVCQYKGPCGIS